MLSPMRHKRHRLRHLPPALVAIIAGLVLTGCARTDARFTERIDEEGNIQARKRIDQNPERDFFHHFTREAYRVPRELASDGEERYALVFHGALSPVGDTVLAPESDEFVIAKEWGKPNWVRKPFRSLLDERVDEWLYMDEDRMFQFVGGMLVYDGPVTDYERILIQRGYPDRHRTSKTDSGNRVDELVYQSVFFPWFEDYYLANGQIVQSQEGH